MDLEANLKIKSIYNAVYQKLIDLTEYYKSIRVLDYIDYRREFMFILRSYYRALIKFQNKQITNSIDDFCKSNCYLYALDLPLPVEISNLYTSLTQGVLTLAPGELGGYSSLNHRMSRLESKFRISSDLNVLGIKSFSIKMNNKPSHNGYKIAYFLNECTNDFHFVRQDENGKWTHQMGFWGDIQELDTSEFQELYDTEMHHLEYIKTLELVKPSFKK